MRASVAGNSRLRFLCVFLTWYTVQFQKAAGLSFGSYPTRIGQHAVRSSASRDENRQQLTSNHDSLRAPSYNEGGLSIEYPVATCEVSRRSVLGGICALSVLASMILSSPDPALARAPGSKDVVAAIQQIQDAAKALKTLQIYWAEYASIDDEGRARSTDGARRMLGGIAPQAGAAAIDAAKNTPLYRIDVAFVTIRNVVLEGSDKSDKETAWRDKLDLERFEELADRVIYGTQKADGNFYSVLFAMKGTTMISDIFEETKKLVQQGINDLDNMILLLQEAGAPGLSQE